MNESIETVFAWGALPALVVGIAWLLQLKKRREAQRTKRLQAAASLLGLTPAPVETNRLQPQLSGFRCYSEGDARTPGNLFTGTHDGIRFQLPRLSVQPKRMLSGLTNGTRLKLDAHPKLDELYLIEADDPAAAQALLSEPLMQFLEQHPGKGLETGEQRFAWYPATSALGSNRVEPSALPGFFDEARTLARLLGNST